MSRGYRIAWPVPQWRVSSATIESADSCTMDVGLLEILPEAEMLALLRARLAEDGWTRDEDLAMSRSFGEVLVRLTPEGRSVEATIRTKREINTRATSEEEAQRQLASAGQALQGELNRALAARLGAAQGEIRAALQGALQRVYVEALQQKAAALGEVESIQETRGAEGELELTIKVRV